MLILAKAAPSGYTSASSSTMGEITLQGWHQGAQKSTTTTLSRRTISSSLSSVTSLGLVVMAATSAKGDKTLTIDGVQASFSPSDEASLEASGGSS